MMKKGGFTEEPPFAVLLPLDSLGMELIHFGTS